MTEPQVPDRHLYWQTASSELDRAKLRRHIDAEETTLVSRRILSEVNFIQDSHLLAWL